MIRFYKHTAFAILLVAVLWSTGCTAGKSPDADDHSAAETLPPLLTDASEETQTTLTNKETAAPEESVYTGIAVKAVLPDDAGELQCFRCAGDNLILLTKTIDDTGQSLGTLYQLTYTDSTEAVPLFTDPDTDAVSALLDFDIRPDGTVCGLLCCWDTAIPYDDPDFDPEDFDWDSYYETASAYYTLAFFDSKGQVSQSLNLTAMLPVDEARRQTAAFTGVRCDQSGQIYLTFVMEDQDFLTALDDDSLLFAAGSTEFTALSAAYQLYRGDASMILRQISPDGSASCAVLSVSDGCLHQTPAPEETIPPEAQPIERYTDTYTTGWQDSSGIYLCNTAAEPLPAYLWDALSIDPDNVVQTVQLSDTTLAASVTGARNMLSLWIIQGQPSNFS